MNRLVLVEESPSAGARHEVSSGDILGREGCEVVLADPEVSRRHAKVRSLDDTLAIEDLGSTNGTFVNGQRQEGVCELKDGDMIKLGNSALRVEAQVEPGATKLTPTQPDPPPPAPPPVEPAPPPAPAPQPAAAVAAPPESPPPRASAPPAEPQPTQFGEIRGDVLPPEPASASRVHRVVSPTPAPSQHKFDAGGTGGTRRGSAATRVEATVVAFAVVLATAVAVILYILAETL